ncbi:MAG: flagellar basal body-associated FliL family protein [bacterium]
MDEERKDNEQKNEASKKTGNLPLIIGGGVLLVVVLGVSGFFAMKALSSPADATETDPTEQVDSEEYVYKSTGFYYREFGAFITVLKPGEEYNFVYLKFVPEFELNDMSLTSEIAAKLPIIEDKINAIMTDLDWGSIKSEKGRARVAEKLTEKLNEHLETGRIIKTFFTTFVAQ